MTQCDTCQLADRYYPGNKRKVDLPNVIAITSKFFLDALVESGKLSADDITVVRGETSDFIEVDKQNPRVEARILEYQAPPIN